jgi:hypothetical protein
VTDLPAIRAALAAKLGTLDNGNIQASPYLLSSPTPPAAHLFPAEVSYDEAMNRGLDQWDFTVQVFVGAITDVGAQQKLDLYLAPTGSSSVKTVLEQDRTLGGLVTHTHVLRAAGPIMYLRDTGIPLLMSEWTVRIRAVGT